MVLSVPRGVPSLLLGSGFFPTLPLLLTFALPTLLLAKDPGSYFVKPRVAALRFRLVSLWSKVGLYSRFCVESSPVAFPVVVVVLLSSFSLRPLSPLVLLSFASFLLSPYRCFCLELWSPSAPASASADLLRHVRSCMD